MSTRRVERVRELLRQQLAELIKENIAEDYGLVTITEIILNDDLREAQVYISCFEKIKEPEVLKLLSDQTKKFQHILGRRLQMKFTPKIKFELDKNLGKVTRVEEILEKIKEN